MILHLDSFLVKPYPTGSTAGSRLQRALRRLALAALFGALVQPMLSCRPVGVAWVGEVMGEVMGWSQDLEPPKVSNGFQRSFKLHFFDFHFLGKRPF